MTKTEKWQIWRDLSTEDNDTGMLIDPDEVEQKVYCNESEVIIIDETDATVYDLEVAHTQFYNDRRKNHLNFFGVYTLEDVEEMLEWADIEAKCRYAEQFENPRDVIVYFNDSFNQEFSNLKDWETVSYYEWWDGSNYKHIYSAEWNEVVIEEVRVTEDYVSLDEWDGRNMVTGGIGEHAYVAKVVGTDEFLLVEWSQWQGSHKTGKLITRDEFIDHLKSLDRDVDEYMKEIDALE